MIRFFATILLLGTLSSPGLATTVYNQPVSELPIVADQRAMDLFFQVICSRSGRQVEDSSALETRMMFQNFLKAPQSEAIRLLAAGSRENTGTFELLVMCGSVEAFKSRMQSRGCFDDQGEQIDHRNALAYCGALNRARSLKKSN